MRSMRAALAAFLAVTVSATVPVAHAAPGALPDSPPPAAAPHSPPPAAVPDSLVTAISTPSAPPATASQVITVTAPRGSTYATLSAWQRRPDGSWYLRLRTPARVGGAGIGPASEQSQYTPEGNMPLDQAFGRLPNPGTWMPYFTTDRYDWWNENPSSPQYNLHVRSATSPGGFSENLYTSGTAYNYAVNMSYNPDRIPWGGSAYFLHVDIGAPTAGCVAVSQDAMAQLLRWLNPRHRPVIDVRADRVWTPKRGTATNTLFTPSQQLYRGQSTSLVGTLVSYFNTPISGAPVQVLSRPRGSATWTVAANLRTNAYGRYSWRVTPAASTDYVVRYGGSTAFYIAMSRQIGLTVR